MSVAPVILDVRWSLTGPPGIEDYRVGHIPGAVFADLDRDLAAPPGQGGRHPLPSAADFQESMRRLGVSGSRPVVVYDAADSSAAARAWWLLRYFGHRDVRVLDGGYRAWTSAGLPVSVQDSVSAQESASAQEPLSAQESASAREPVSAHEPLSAEQNDSPDPGQAGDFVASPGHLPLLDADAAASIARTGLLLDARAAERYRGEVEPVDPVAGHIPGAVSAPTAQNVAPDGTFRPPAELAERFAGLGAASASSVAAYCGSGVTAAHEVLALTLAGIPAALYAGSWSEWVTDPSRPVETGPGAG